MPATIFDPLSRKETWLFQQVRLDERQQPVYKRLKYNLVEYDGVPDAVIEPVNICQFVDVVTSANTGVVVNAANGDQGSVGRFQIVTSRPFEAQSFDDFDAFTNGISN